MNRPMDEKDAERAFAEAVAAYGKGDLALAERRLAALRRSFPGHPDVLHLLGVVRLGLHRPAEAAESLRSALRAAEAAGRADILAPVLNALGSAERRAGEPARAAEILERAVRLVPGDADCHFNLGNALWDLGRFADAAGSFRAAAALSPRDPAIRFALGEALARAGDGEAGAEAYAAAAALDPGHAKARAALGALRLERNDIAGARESLEKALELDPGLAEAHLNLGILRIAAGEADAGVAASRRAIELKPALASAHSNLVQQMSYSARHSAEEILAEARRWNAVHARPRATRAKPHANARDPEKRLKVGYVGGDFRAHPVGYFSLSLFAHHDAVAVETFVYMTHPRIDALSERIRAHVRHWRGVPGLDEAALAEMVRADGIDILVDMAGHTAKNRLLALAERPAPIQAVGGGVMGTTGMDAVDYFLADAVEIPPGYERFYSESVVRLPNGNVCYAPPDYAREVAALPARTEGRVTFGCFNAAAKVTPESVALWARVLGMAPGSRMFLKSFAYADPETRARFARLFADAGVPGDRLILEGPSPHAELLAAYGGIDIALDPVPYSGGLTTLEALWMGVPVVTLPGETFASRHSASHLANAGHPELIAGDADGYVAIARRLASDLDALAALRAALRPRMAASPVCDGAAYARNLESAYRAMWRAWCRGENPRSFDVPPS
ncbi:MAG: tetratricopeptide repeat protein [Rhodospirillales bacterium]|nr:tetratricopeptide repeat protein [Rhodospirillales bacterium]